MNITGNMTVVPVPNPPVVGQPTLMWHLTMAYAGQTQLHLNIQNTKGSEHHWAMYTEIQEAGNWYTLSQRDCQDWIDRDASFHRMLELPDTADNFRLIIKMFIDPEADFSATGSIDIQAQLS